MDQTTARRLAANLGGVATQESRYRGQWGRADDPWIVVMPSGVIHREVPQIDAEEQATADYFARRQAEAEDQ